VVVKRKSARAIILHLIIKFCHNFLLSLHTIKLQRPVKNIREVDEMFAREAFGKPTATPE
jgi:hypothetical protein